MGEGLAAWVSVGQAWVGQVKRGKKAWLGQAWEEKAWQCGLQHGRRLVMVGSVRGSKGVQMGLVAWVEGREATAWVEGE